MPPRQLFPTTPSCDGLPRTRRLVAALVAVPGLFPALSHAQLAGDAAQAQPIDAPWGLRLAPQLEEHTVPGGDRPATFVLGDSTTGTLDRDMAAKGSAEVRRNAAVIKADALHYDQDTDMADAYGQVHVSGSGSTFVGPEAHMKVDSSEGYMTAPKYHFTTTGGSGSAERVDLLDNERSVFANGTYTACQCTDNPAWYIKGSEFDFDTGADEGVAHNGVLFFQGVPVFASPWLSFPVVRRPQERRVTAGCIAEFEQRAGTVGSVLLQHRPGPRPDADAAPHFEARCADAGELPVSVAYL